MSSDLSKTEVSRRFSEENMFILPEAAEHILGENNPNQTIEQLVESLESGATVDKSKVKSIIEQEKSKEDTDPSKDHQDEQTHEKENVTDHSEEEENTEETIEEDRTVEQDLQDKNKVQEQSSAESDKSKDAEDKKDQPAIQTESLSKSNLDSKVVQGDSISPSEAFEKIKNNKKSTKDAEQVINRKETLDDRFPEWCDTMFDRDLPEAKERIDVDSDYEIKGDITGRSRGTGDFDDFRKLFEDRYEKMINLLDQRVGGARKVGDIHPRRHGGEQLTVVGLVWSKNVSRNGNYFIDLEDPSTNELLTVGWTDDSIKDRFEEVMEDEVIAIRGNLADDGDIMWGDDEVERGRPPIMFPDIPRRKNRDGPSRPVKAAMISDIHVGANEFYPEYWNDFVDWIRSDPTVNYLFVAGDLVEGVGVYPDQDEELHVLDIHDQYAMVGRMFEQIPDDIQIFASVGNHDTVRLAEPQPTLDEKFRKYFPNNTEFVGNPVTVEVNNIRVLMYHGMSINAISEVIPGFDPAEPIPIMEMMLKKRHVAPVYGKNVRLAPEEKDYLVIEDVPDVLHCGHVHKYGQETYNGVQMINTATWQGQTSFQKSKGIEPEVGHWSVIDLSTRETNRHKVDKSEE